MASSGDDLATVNIDDTFVKLMQESGMTVVLTEKNRQMVVQCLIQHLVLSKRIATLDQVATGLETHGLLNSIRAKPDVFEALFVASRSKISPDAVKKIFRLKPTSSGCTAAVTIFSMVNKYIEESSEDELKQLLKFSTGGEERPPSGVVFVEVSPDNESIYASTCLCEVIFPQNMASLEYKHFKGALSAVVQDDSFNCI